MICIFVAQHGQANINIQNSPMACREEKTDFSTIPTLPWPSTSWTRTHLANLKYLRTNAFKYFKKFDLIGKPRLFPNHGVFRKCKFIEKQLEFVVEHVLF